MHEKSLIDNLVKKIEALAAAHGADRITGVKVRLGALSHISAEHFREHFEHETGGTIAEGASLEVEVSEDLNDPHAQDILLVSVDVEG